MHLLNLPKICRRALVVAIPKLNKPLEDPKSYRPISLLFVSFKTVERLIFAHVKPIIDILLPKEQTGFCSRMSTIDRVTLLTQKIEDSFLAKKKGGAVFVIFTAVYDTVWHRGFTCKLLHLFLYRHIVSLIMELVCNQSFTLIIGTGRKAGYDALRMASPKD